MLFWPSGVTYLAGSAADYATAGARGRCISLGCEEPRCSFGADACHDRNRCNRPGAHGAQTRQFAPCHAITHRGRQARRRLGHLETVAAYHSDGTTASGIPNRDVISEWDIASRYRSGTVQNANAQNPETLDRRPGAERHLGRSALAGRRRADEVVA